MRQKNLKILSRFARLIALLSIVILILCGLIFFLRGGKTAPSEDLPQVIDYDPTESSKLDLSQYRKVANFLESDFDPDLGKEIFMIRCASCHKVSANNSVGPGLLNLLSRVPDRQWLLNFMSNSDSILKLPIPYNETLRNKNWPVQNWVHHDSIISKVEILQVLGYIGIQQENTIPNCY